MARRPLAARFVVYLSCLAAGILHSATRFASAAAPQPHQEERQRQPHEEVAERCRAFKGFPLVKDVSRPGRTDGGLLKNGLLKNAVLPFTRELPEGEQLTSKRAPKLVDRVYGREYSLDEFQIIVPPEEGLEEEAPECDGGEKGPQPHEEALAEMVGNTLREELWVLQLGALDRRLHLLEKRQWLDFVGDPSLNVRDDSLGRVTGEETVAGLRRRDRQVFAAQFSALRALLGEQIALGYEDTETARLLQLRELAVGVEALRKRIDLQEQLQALEGLPRVVAGTDSPVLSAPEVEAQETVVSDLLRDVQETEARVAKAGRDVLLVELPVLVAALCETWGKLHSLSEALGSMILIPTTRIKLDLATLEEIKNFGDRLDEILTQLKEHIHITTTRPDDGNQDVIPVARIIQILMKEANMAENEISDFEQQFVSAIDKEDYYGIFMNFADKADLVVKQVEKRKGAGATSTSSVVAERIECYFSTLIYMLSLMSTVTKLQSAVSKVVDLLLGGKEYAPLRLKMLQTSYNAIPVTPVTAPLSRRIFFGVLNYAAENELFHELVPYLDTFEEWMGAWQQEEAQMLEDRKELYYLIATQIPLLKAEVKLSMSQVSEELSFKWMQKYLNIETEVNDRSKEAIAKFVREIVELPSVYEVEGLLEIEVLQKAAKQDPQTNKLTSMLQLLVTGTIEELEAFQKTNPGFIEQQGVSTSALTNKLRVLTLCSVCEGRSEIPLDEVRSKLKCQDVDDLIIEASHYGVLVGRIDEVRQVLEVQTVLQRRFQKKEWEKLDGLLEKWITKIDLLQGLALAN
eukprot:g1795.t1